MKIKNWFLLLSGKQRVWLFARLGRPDLSGIKQQSQWYPRAPYIAALLVSVIAAGDRNPAWQPLSPLFEFCHIAFNSMESLPLDPCGYLFGPRRQVRKIRGFSIC